MISGIDGVSLKEAQSIVTRSVRTLEQERLPRSRAVGRIIRQDVISDVDYPSADVSAVDGYCFAASATSGASQASPKRLRITDVVKAGKSPAFRLDMGSCASIMTGAALPGDTDAVVRREDVESVGQHIVIRAPVLPQNLVRKVGEIAKKGDLVLESGALITPLMAGLLSSLGSNDIDISRKPSVAVIATGDEIVPGNVYPPTGCIRGSNSPILTSLLTSAGCDVYDAGISHDTEEDLLGHVEMCLDRDVIVTTGGVAGGEYDVVAECLKRIGADIVFSEVRMMPGRRTSFARKGDLALFCLPGNPVSAVVMFQMLVRPALMAMMGVKDVLPLPLKVRIASALEKQPQLLTLIPSRLLPDLRVQPVRFLGSGDVRGLARVNSLISVEEDIVSVAAENLVDVFPIEGVWSAAQQTASP
jgi:molybdopterin molybdotransferase